MLTVCEYLTLTLELGTKPPPEVELYREFIKVAASARVGVELDLPVDEV